MPSVGFHLYKIQNKARLYCVKGVSIWDQSILKSMSVVPMVGIMISSEWRAMVHGASGMLAVFCSLSWVVIGCSLKNILSAVQIYFMHSCSYVTYITIKKKNGRNCFVHLLFLHLCRLLASIEEKVHFSLLRLCWTQQESAILYQHFEFFF